ncbi:type II toxin-antitoxin system Phd/YefM family antitoxin [Acetanaerobacterium elongatum]|uniref:Antitoxin Phd_YefM, type II toxin-antitoxin system n=1 Tax=Acetanaerobacterium elongatum TaxID=258515 RepID=A0A1H0E979_9FIRM|nr:type II toxin-antitoxin system Phd/YefM family antitoxin [Acetanaerobacterium elongatum]SDN78960.1 Antitoxin Phd_YefM, type II toxin-antitoxin system [Acetanaerobacterium elongatum]
MMDNMASVKNVMNTIVPITRFNRGEASKIFDEVSENGFKIVLKNNTPACVLVEPQRYEAMIEALEDYALFFEAEKRMKTAQSNDFISSEKVMADLNIHESDLDTVEVEIEP